MAVAVVSIPVADPQKSLEYYRDTLGFTVMRDEPMGPEMRWIQMQPKDGGSSLALVTWFEGMGPGGLQGLMIGVDDLDGEYARLKGLGVTLTPVEEQPWGRFSMLNDIDGNGLILAQLSAPEDFRAR